MIQNFVWYLLLVMLSSLVLIYTIWKKKDADLFALYLFMSGLIYTFEFFVLVVFEGYVYYPGVLSIEYFDNVLGASVSNAFSVPMIATYIAAFNFGIVTFVAASVMFMGVEWLFVHLGIYEHYWWKYAYTGLGLVAAFYIAQRWNFVVRRHIHQVYRSITMFFICTYLAANASYIAAGILNKYFYSVDWFADPVRGHVAFATLHSFALAFLFTLLINKSKLGLIIVGVLGTLPLDILLIEQDILKLSDGWSLFYFIPMRFLIITLLVLVDRFLLQRPSPTSA